MARCNVLALLALASCAAPTRRHCELEPPELIARSEGLVFDGVAVAGDAAHRVYAWSEQAGLFVRERGVRRLGERCHGGLDVLVHQGETWVACSRPDEVVLYRGAQAIDVGEAGRDGHGVALAALGKQVHVAYHRGALGDHGIWLAQAGGEPRRISHEGKAAREPTLVARAGHLYAAFAELSLEGAPASKLFVSRDGSQAKQIADTRAYSPTPRLTADDRGLVLGYRDRAKEGARSELRVVRLDDAGHVSGAASVVGRANDVGDPNLYGCGELVAALLPREYGGERYVGIHALDEQLSALGNGHQLYESGHDFTLAAGTCDAHGLQLFAADRAAPSKPGVEAIALRFRCD
ncbi:MAG: hypothetical protein ABW352_21020 [Polyangiales bacterium]